MIMNYLLPHVRYERIVDIEPETLQFNNIKALILDIDNTMALHDMPEPLSGVKEWVERIKAAGIDCIVISNNCEQRVAPFAKKFDIPYISKSKKPLPKVFVKAAKILDTKPSNAAVIGDQIFTDILGGRLAGMFCIYVDPIGLERGGFFAFKRFLEKVVFKFYNRKRG